MLVKELKQINIMHAMERSDEPTKAFKKNGVKYRPDFMAVCVPFIFGTSKKPAEHPIIAPPGKTGYGID